MKKLFVLAIAIILGFSLNAQKFGLRFGGNFAGMMTTLDSKGTKIAPGMTFGLVSEFGQKMVSLRAEVNFAQKGYNIDKDTDIGTNVLNTVGQVNYNYLEVPVLLKIQFFGPLYAYAGPYFGFALKGETVFDEVTLDGVAVPDEDLTLFGLAKETDLFSNDLYKKTDFGLAGGVGVQFGLGPIHAFAEGRATLGLSNLYDSEGDAFQALVDSGGLLITDNKKNMVFTVAIGILLGK